MNDIELKTMTMDLFNNLWDVKILLDDISRCTKSGLICPKAPDVEQLSKRADELLTTIEGTFDRIGCVDNGCSCGGKE